MYYSWEEFQGGRGERKSNHPLAVARYWDISKMLQIEMAMI
jgi:hypothetical protein